MNYEQIMIKLGVDGSAVRTGLGRVGAYVRSWGVGLVEELKGTFGRILAVGAAYEGFAKVREEITEIKRLSDELGVSTNFIQSLQLEAQKSGVSIETLTRPLVAFNREVGYAKRGLPEYIAQLKDMGIISNKSQLATLTYSDAMKNLKTQFDKIGDSAKQDALLNEAFGNSAYRVAFIFRQSVADFNGMNQGGFFTKFSTNTIETATSAWANIKTFAYGAAAGISNALESTYLVGKHVFGTLFTTPSNQNLWKKLMDTSFLDDKKAIESQEQIAQAKAVQLQKDEDDIEVQQRKSEILAQQAELMERQSELTSEISDRDKLGVSDLAARTRQIMGIKSPLELSHTITPRMRTALNIDTLEERAKLAWERGNDILSIKLQGEADQIRRSNPWLKRQDFNPMQKTETELQVITTQLAPVKRMAELVTKDAQ